MKFKDIKIGNWFSVRSNVSDDIFVFKKIEERIDDDPVFVKLNIKRPINSICVSNGFGQFFYDEALTEAA